jgi:hypothetical protein
MQGTGTGTGKGHLNFFKKKEEEEPVGCFQIGLRFFGLFIKFCCASF